MASGNTLVVFDALSGAPPSANFANLGVRNAQPHLAFDAATDESITFRAVMPQHYAGTTGVTVHLHWRATTATTGNVVWNTAFELQADAAQDTDSDGFATANTGTFGTVATAGALDYASIAHTNGAQMDSVVAGSVFRLRVTRDADNGSDTMTGDAELVSVEIRET